MDRASGRPRALATAASIASPPGSGTHVSTTLAKLSKNANKDLLGSSQPKDFLPDPLDTGHESLFGADEFLAAPRQFLFHQMADEGRG